MDDVLRAAYGLCGVTAYTGAIDDFGSGRLCVSEKYERPLEVVTEFRSELNDLDNHNHDSSLEVPSISQSRPVILWGTGKLAHVIVAREPKSVVSYVFDSDGKEITWPTNAWTLMTNDLHRIAMRTSLKTLETFFTKAAKGHYDAIFSRMADDDRKALAASLVLRILPEKAYAFGTTATSMYDKLKKLNDDPFVITAMAVAGDQRWIDAVTDPTVAALAATRAHRLFLRYGTTTHTIYDHLKEAGAVFGLAAVAISKAEKQDIQTDRIVRSDRNAATNKPVIRLPDYEEPQTLPFNLGDELRALRKAQGYEDESDADMFGFDAPAFVDDTEKNRELNMMYNATRTAESAAPERIPLDDIRAELTIAGITRAHELTVEEATAILKLKRARDASSRKEFLQLMQIRRRDTNNKIDEEEERLRGLSPDTIRFRALAAGLKADDITGLAMFLVDPLSMRSPSVSQARAAELRKAGGVSTFDSRREEYERSVRESRTVAS